MSRAHLFTPSTFPSSQPPIPRQESEIESVGLSVDEAATSVSHTQWMELLHNQHSCFIFLYSLFLLSVHVSLSFSVPLYPSINRRWGGMGLRVFPVHTPDIVSPSFCIFHPSSIASSGVKVSGWSLHRKAKVFLSEQEPCVHASCLRKNCNHVFHQQAHTERMPWRLSKWALNNVDKFKYLGVTLDQTLSFKYHVKKLRNTEI